MNTIFYKAKRLFGILFALLSLSFFLGCGSDDSGGGTPPPPPTTYTVTFNINGGLYGSFGNTKDVTVSEIEPGTLLGELPRKPAPVHLDFTKDFAVWNTEADGSGEFYEDYSRIDSDMILYAIYADDLAALALDLIECDDPSVLYTLSGNVTFAAADIPEPVCKDAAFMGRIYGKGNTVVFALPAGIREYAGFFEKLDGALINGLNVTNTGTLTASDFAGVLAGVIENSTVEYVKVGGSVTASGSSDAFAGGITGTLDNSTVRFVKNAAAVSVTAASTDSAAGGIAGKAVNGSKIISAGSSGFISGSAAGGLAGVVESGGKVTASASSGVLSGGTVGGIAAKVEVTAEISECYTLIPSITGTVAAGGIAGSLNGGSLANSAALGNLMDNGSAAAELGRIAGEVVSGDMSNLFARGDMLVNYEKAAAGGKNGVSKSMPDVRKNREFFETDLGWNLDGNWLMPDYYELPQTIGDPYTEITSVEEFQAIGNDTASAGGKYILMNDLDFTGVTGWVSIGTVAVFNGELYGNEKAIKNFYIESPSPEDTTHSLFTTFSGALRDLRIDNATVEGLSVARGNQPSTNAGIIALLTLNGTFDRVHVTDSRIVGGSTTGGFTGTLQGNRNYIIESSFDGEVSANYNPSQGNFLQAAGGFIGGPYHTTAGVPAAGSSAVILSSYTKGLISQNQVSTGRPAGGVAYVGGMIGSGLNGATVFYTIINSYSAAEIRALGGLYVFGGGLVGFLPGKSVILNSYASGDVRAEIAPITLPVNATNLRKAAGGLIATFIDTASSIKIIGSMAFNGKLTIADNAPDTITGINRLQTFGRIAADKRQPNGVATLVTAANIVLENVYYNEDTDFETELVGNNITPTYTALTNEAGNGVTLPQPQTFYEAAGWDFEYTWKMPEGGGLPVLQWEE
jgi:hypothetical protein